MHARNNPRGGAASAPLLLGLPVGALVGLGIGALNDQPGLGAAIGTPSGLMIGLIITVFWEQLRKRDRRSE